MYSNFQGLMTEQFVEVEGQCPESKKEVPKTRRGSVLEDCYFHSEAQSFF
jgi:hypothetical protein